MSPFDEDLVRRCQQGELAAFTELFQQSETHVYRLALTILRHEQDAEDAVQDVFLRVFERIKRYRGKASFQTWLTAVVVNVCRDRLRRKKVRRALSLEWLRHKPGGQDVTETVVRRQREQHLWSLVNRLDDKHRLPVILHYLERLPCDEVAHILDIPTSTVYSRLNTARQRLRQLAREHTAVSVRLAGDA